MRHLILGQHVKCYKDIQIIIQFFNPIIESMQSGASEMASYCLVAVLHRMALLPTVPLLLIHALLGKSFTKPVFQVGPFLSCVMLGFYLHA